MKPKKTTSKAGRPKPSAHDRIRIGDIENAKSPKWKSHPLVADHGCKPEDVRLAYASVRQSSAKKTFHKWEDRFRKTARARFYRGDFTGFAEIVEDLQSNGIKVDPYTLAMELKNYGERPRASRSTTAKIRRWLLDNWVEPEGGRSPACIISNAREMAARIDAEGIDLSELRDPQKYIKDLILSEGLKYARRPRKALAYVATGKR